MPRRKEPDHIVHRDKDLRIEDADPWTLARKLTRGGAPKREESDVDDDGED